MSLNTQEKLRCPKCGHLNDITLWQSLTVSDSPDLKQALLKCDYSILKELEEIRIRAGQPIFLLTGDEEYMLGDKGVTKSALLSIRPDMEILHIRSYSALLTFATE